MKTLIKILIIIVLTFLVTFTMNSQIEIGNLIVEKDKIYHAVAGVTLAEIGFIPYYTSNWEWQSAFILSCSLPVLAGWLKECADGVIKEHFSYEDFYYTAGAGLITAGSNLLVAKLLDKHKKRKFSLSININNNKFIASKNFEATLRLKF